MTKGDLTHLNYNLQLPTHLEIINLLVDPEIKNFARKWDLVSALYLEPFYEDRFYRHIFVNIASLPSSNRCIMISIFLRSQNMSVRTIQSFG